MNFKKFGGQIFGVEFTAKEQRAMDAEINRQLVEKNREFSDDVDYMVMKILHDHFGFGLKRLRRFYEHFMRDTEYLEKRYEMCDASTYIAREEMNALGANIEKWNQERSE